MRVSLVAAAIALIFASSGAGAAPVGLEISLEVGADGSSNPQEFEMYLRPEARYALGATGLNVALAWQAAVLPEAVWGAIETWQEYETLLPGLSLLAGNNNTLELKTFDVEGYLYLIAEHSLRDLSLEMELDFSYTPEVSITAIPALAYEMEFGPGTISAGMDQSVSVAPRLEWGDTEFHAGYEISLREFGIALEVSPILTAGGGFSLSVQARVARSL